MLVGKLKKPIPDTTEPCKINEVGNYEEKLREELASSLEEQGIFSGKKSDGKSSSTDVLEPLPASRSLSSQESDEHFEAEALIDDGVQCSQLVL